MSQHRARGVQIHSLINQLTGCAVPQVVKRQIITPDCQLCGSPVVTIFETGCPCYKQ